MPKKRSIKLSADNFKSEVVKIRNFLASVSVGQSAKRVAWLYDYAIIRLYKEFEGLMLDVLVGAVNNDTSTLADTTGVSFPKHLNSGVCEFLIVGTGYFDFNGRSGLIKTLKSFLPEGHYLRMIIGDSKYKQTLDQLIALRNFAAHGSTKSKRAALEATKQ